MLVFLCGAAWTRSNETEYLKVTVTEAKPLIYQIAFFETYLMAGAAIFARVENWSYLDAVLEADCTILTVGLGDYAPKTHIGQNN